MLEARYYFAPLVSSHGARRFDRGLRCYRALRKRVKQVSMRLFRLLGLCATLIIAVWASSHLRLLTQAEDAANDDVVATDEATNDSAPRRPRPERISLAGSEALQNEI